MEVFSFTLKVVPPLIKSILALAQVGMDEVAMCVMHQANKFILEHLRKKLGIPKDKYIIDMEQFGNTSSASVPLAMCHQLADFYTKTPRKTLMAGFGVGWSWGAMIMDILPEVIFELVEMPDDIVPLSLKQ
jgi:3-oxoacyl-[acyl-carrier-protein] synthase-3